MTPANGSQVTVAQVLSGTLTDTKEKPLNFKVEKGTSVPTFIARGKDGQIYSVSLDSALVTMNVAPKPNYKQLRKEGRPIPKDKAEEADKQIKKEKEREEKVASGEMSAEDAAKEVEKERKEAEKEEQEEETEETEEEPKKSEPQPGLRSSQRERGR